MRERVYVRERRRVGQSASSGSWALKYLLDLLIVYHQNVENVILEDMDTLQSIQIQLRTTDPRPI